MKWAFEFCSCSSSSYHLPQICVYEGIKLILVGFLCGFVLLEHSRYVAKFHVNEKGNIFKETLTVLNRNQTF